MERKRIKAHDGISLVEIILATAMLVIIIGAGFMAVKFTMKQNVSDRDRTKMMEGFDAMKHVFLDLAGMTNADSSISFDFDSEHIVPGSNIPSKMTYVGGKFWFVNKPGDETHFDFEHADTPPASWYQSPTRYSAEVGPLINQLRLVKMTYESKIGATTIKQERQFYLGPTRRTKSGASIHLRVIDGSNLVPVGVGLGGVRVELWDPLTNKKIREAAVSGPSGDVDIYGLKLDTKYMLKLDGSISLRDQAGATSYPYYSRNQSNVWASALIMTIGSDVSGDPAIIIPKDDEDQLIDLGTKKLWPYGQIHGKVIRHGTTTPISGVGIVLRAIRTEAAQTPPLQDLEESTKFSGYSLITDVNGEYRFPVMPGFYYLAARESVTDNTKKVGTADTDFIQNPDLRDLVTGDTIPWPVQDTTDDPAVTYGAPVVLNEVSSVNSWRTRKTNLASDSNVPPKAVRIMPLAAVYDTASNTTLPLNDPKRTDLELRTMGTLQFNVTLAAVDSDTFERGSSNLSGEINQKFLVNAYKDPLEIYPPWKPNPSTTPSPPGGQPPSNPQQPAPPSQPYTALDTFVQANDIGLRIRTSTDERYRVKGAWIDQNTGVGKISNFCVNFFNTEFRKDTSPNEIDQFAQIAYPLLFPYSWGGNLAPLIVLFDNPAQNKPARQIYLAWNGLPTEAHGRSDGLMYTYFPNPNAFNNVYDTDYLMPDPTPTPAGTFVKKLIDFELVSGESGESFWGNPAGVFDTYSFFHDKFECGHQGKTVSMSVVQKNQLGNLKGKITYSNGTTPWFVPGNPTKEMEMSAWGMECVPENDCSGKSFINFSYKVHSSPSSPGSHTYTFLAKSMPSAGNSGTSSGSNRIVPTLNITDIPSWVDGESASYTEAQVDLWSYGNGRVVNAIDIEPGTPTSYRIVNVIRAKYKGWDSGGAGKYYMADYLPSELNSSSFGLEATTAGGGLLWTSTIKTPQVPYIGGNVFIETANQKTMTPVKIYTGKSAVVSLKPGEDLDNVNVLMNAAADYQHTPIYIRLNTSAASPQFTDYQAPKGTGRVGVQSLACFNTSQAGCLAYAQYESGMSARILPRPFYGLQYPAMQINKIDKPGGGVKIYVKGPNDEDLPNVAVRVLTTSIAQYRQTGNGWKDRCVFKTGPAGEPIDLTNSSSYPTPVSCSAGQTLAKVLEFDTFENANILVVPQNGVESGLYYAPGSGLRASEASSMNPNTIELTIKYLPNPNSTDSSGGGHL